MFAASTYEEIEQRERQVENKEIVVFLFVKPTSSAALDIIREFEYIHYNSGKYCSIYAIGFTDDLAKAEDPSYKKIETVCNSDWFFSSKAFVDFKNRLERRIKWQYSGETEVLVLQNNPGHENALNFQNYVAVDVNKGLRDGYLDSFQRFMESLVRSSKAKVTAKEALTDMANRRLSVRDILCSAIDDCKRIPAPVKEILADRLFYRCANTFAS